MTEAAEFRLIARHFRPLAGAGALDLLDDAALLTPPPGRTLVIAADALVEGVHFLPGTTPDLIARKLLRVNLSDLAAMGADPLGYLLTVAVPRHTPDTWFAAFAAGLAEDQARYGLALLGGDTTSTPGPATLSLTVLGSVAPGQELRRAGAKPGDEIWVTGTIGDGALGLDALAGRLADPSGHLAARYHLPHPRLGLRLFGIASAGADISDGLVQDLGHLCHAGQLGAEIETAHLPLSDAARALGPSVLPRCLGGGDDYELVLAIPPDRTDALRAEAARAGVPVTRIGRFVSGTREVIARDATGTKVTLASTGWSHFKPPLRAGMPHGQPKNGAGGRTP